MKPARLGLIAEEEDAGAGGSTTPPPGMSFSSTGSGSGFFAVVGFGWGLDWLVAAFGLEELELGAGDFADFAAAAEG